MTTKEERAYCFPIVLPSALLYHCSACLRGPGGRTYQGVPRPAQEQSWLGGLWALGPQLKVEDSSMARGRSLTGIGPDRQGQERGLVEGTWGLGPEAMECPVWVLRL